MTVNSAALPGDLVESPLDELTPREREVVQLLAEGKSNKEVARALEMSVGTSDGASRTSFDGLFDSTYTALEQLARDRGCGGIELDSGTHRTRAHKFYFREGFIVPSFAFRKEFK